MPTKTAYSHYINTRIGQALAAERIRQGLSMQKVIDRLNASGVHVFNNYIVLLRIECGTRILSAIEFFVLCNFYGLDPRFPLSLILTDEPAGAAPRACARVRARACDI